MLQPLYFNLDDCKEVQNGSCTVHHDGNTSFLMTVPEHPYWQELSICNERPERIFYVNELEPGFYNAYHNFDEHINAYTDFKAANIQDRIDYEGKEVIFDFKGSSYISYYKNTLGTYGIADNIEQIKSKYREIIMSNTPVVFSVFQIEKKEEPPEDGFCFREHGDYIGVESIVSSFLYDEPFIESVLFFKIIVLEHKPELSLIHSKNIRLK